MVSFAPTFYGWSRYARSYDSVTAQSRNTLGTKLGNAKMEVDLRFISVIQGTFQNFYVSSIHSFFFFFFLWHFRETAMLTTGIRNVIGLYSKGNANYEIYSVLSLG